MQQPVADLISPYRIESDYKRATKDSTAAATKAKVAGKALQLWQACSCLNTAITLLETQEA